MKRVYLLSILAILHTSCRTRDWPDWRGENRDAVWETSGVVEEFESGIIDLKWSVPLGPGYSGPTVSGGKVYVTDRIERPVQAERVRCFDAESGEQIWLRQYECEYVGVGYQAGPRASVVLSDGKAYSLGTMGHLFCFDAESGEVLWKRNLNSEYEIIMPTWGLASTPLVVDDKLIVHAGGSGNACVVAFDKDTGKEIWRSLDDHAAYSAPILVEKNGQRVVVNWTQHSLSGLDPESGKVYWRFPWKTGSGMSIATPVLYRDHIFVSAFYSGSLLIKLGEDYTTAEKVWQRSGESERKTDALHCVMNTPLIIDDYIYGVDSYGELRCLEFSGGDRLWEDLTVVKKDRWANIHFIQQGALTWMFNEHGELLITRLTPDGLEMISRAKLIEPTRKQLARGVVWAHPAFAGTCVYVRNDERLVCADLSAK